MSVRGRLKETELLIWRDGDCSARDLSGFLFGISSIACWIVAQVGSRSFETCEPIVFLC